MRADPVAAAAARSTSRSASPNRRPRRVVAEFAEQFSVDVSAITGEQRSRLLKALGDSTFGVVVQMYIADFVPRVRAGLEALGCRCAVSGLDARADRVGSRHRAVRCGVQRLPARGGPDARA